MDNIGFVLQARLGSSRLPGKIMLPFYEGKSILEIQIELLKQYFPQIKIVLATTEKQEDEALEQMALKHSVCFFRGSENDCLDRFIKAAEKFNIQKIIRVCTDNVFLQPDFINEILKHSGSPGVDYISHKFPRETPAIKTHFGFFTEYATLRALKKAQSLTTNPTFTEHVTRFLYEHPEEFSLLWLDVPASLAYHSNIRLTTDTIEDFNLNKHIYAEVIERYNDPRWESILRLIDNQENIEQKMATLIKSNPK